MRQLDIFPLFTQSGIVKRGTETAREVGFPTANIRFEDPDISGTYAGKVIMGDKEYSAAIYANQKRKLLEAHLLDFSGDLYGKQVTVILLERLADAKVFPDVQEQQRFIEWAVVEVREYFSQET